MKKLLICALTLTALSSVANAVCPTEGDQVELMSKLSDHKNELTKGTGFTISLQGTSVKPTTYKVTVDQTSGVKSDFNNITDGTVYHVDADRTKCKFTLTNKSLNDNKSVLAFTLNSEK